MIVRTARRGWLGALLVVACSGYPRPNRSYDATTEPPDSPIDAIVDAPIDSGPQGVTPTAGTASVSGTTNVGSTLTASPSGFQLGMPAGTYHYQWQRCTTSACTSTTAIGSDAATYALVSGDGGAYIRVGIYASNSCMSGCGSSATAYSSAVGPVKRVDLAKGGACSVNGCASGCNFYAVSVVGFGGGNHTVTCNASNTTNPWYSYTASSFPSSVCCYGFPGQTTWATVDGLRSANLTW